MDPVGEVIEHVDIVNPKPTTVDYMIDGLSSTMSLIVIWMWIEMLWGG